VLISAITIGDRARRDMGDLRGLADSIATHGMLHPIVVRPDGMLIAGHRRIEAAKLLGWDEIPATVVDVADLLSAERDENAERKDFTPSEAVSIGRLIEEAHRAKIEAKVHESAVLAGKKRQGSDMSNQPPAAIGPTREAAARAVGMGPIKYTQAKAVVAAAEADPEKFGDLPGRMDETSNVSGTHRELERRKSNGASGRHPVHHHSRRRDQTKEMERAIAHIEGAASVFGSIDADALDEGRKPEWISSLGEVRTQIGRAIKRLRGERE